jgi:hypothetical protein
VRRFADRVIVGGMLALAASASLTPANTRHIARLSVAGSRLLIYCHASASASGRLALRFAEAARISRMRIKMRQSG